MTEDEAQAALRAFAAFDDLERWIADERWQATTDGGWTVLSGLDNWRFRLRPVPDGVRVSATAPGGGAPATWVVPEPSAAPVDFGRCAQPRARCE